MTRSRCHWCNEKRRVQEHMEYVNGERRFLKLCLRCAHMIAEMKAAHDPYWKKPSKRHDEDDE